MKKAKKGQMKPWLIAAALTALAPTVQATTATISKNLTPSTPTSKTPSPFTPVFAIITNFTGYTGPFTYLMDTFYVGNSGTFKASLSSAPVSNGFYILKGKFAPSTGTPTTSLSNFIVFSQQLSNTVISNIQLEPGQEYTFLAIFNTGTATVVMKLEGDGCISWTTNTCLLKPVANQAQLMAALDNMTVAQASVGERLTDLREDVLADAGSTGLAAGDSEATKHLWVKLQGGRSLLGEREGLAGFKGRQTGFAVGGDADIAENTRLGVGFSHTQNHLDYQQEASGSSGDVKSNQILVYISHDLKDAYIDGTLAFAQHHFQGDRVTGASSASGDWRGKQWSLKVEGGMPMVMDNVTVTPMGSLTLSRLHQNGYTESGSGALQVNESTYRSAMSSLGVKVSGKTEIGGVEVRPHARLSWQHEFAGSKVENSTASVGSSTFSTAGRRLSRNEVSLSLGLTAKPDKNSAITLSVDLSKRGDYRRNSIQLSGRWDF